VYAVCAVCVLQCAEAQAREGCRGVHSYRGVMLFLHSCHTVVTEV
jgi:hypothetical protein